MAVKGFGQMPDLVGVKSHQPMKFPHVILSFTPGNPVHPSMPSVTVVDRSFKHHHSSEHMGFLLTTLHLKRAKLV